MPGAKTSPTQQYTSCFVVLCCLLLLVKNQNKDQAYRVQQSVRVQSQKELKDPAMSVLQRQASNQYSKQHVSQFPPLHPHQKSLWINCSFNFCCTFFSLEGINLSAMWSPANTTHFKAARTVILKTTWLQSLHFIFISEKKQTSLQRLFKHHFKNGISMYAFAKLCLEQNLKVSLVSPCQVPQVYWQVQKFTLVQMLGQFCGNLYSLMFILPCMLVDKTSLKNCNKTKNPQTQQYNQYGDNQPNNYQYLQHETFMKTSDH